jgi:teichuronic acid biosynthesis glycosyltransferase TuaH
MLLFAPSRRLFGVVGERVRVYYAKDDFSAASTLLGVSGARSAADETWAAENADLVVAHSPTLMQRWSDYAPLFVPNGVDAASYGNVDAAPLPTDIALPRPIVGFIGMLTHRIDYAILDAIATRGRSLLLVGPRQNSLSVETMGALLRRPNVTWTGGRRYDELPSYLRVIDVGIVPYADTAFNRASFPLKTLEYLAAGRAVVATPLPAVEWLDSDLITVAAGAEAFADAVDDAIARSLENDRTQERQQYARQHDWHMRVQPLAARLGLRAP